MGGQQAVKRRGQWPEYEPTSQEIRAACLEIQAEWSPEIEKMRRVYDPPASWQAPRARIVVESQPGED